MEVQEMCSVCARNGKASKLKIYQINFEEAIRFCEDDECTYPAGMDNSSWVLNRKFSELQVGKPSVVKKKSLPQRTHQFPVKPPDYNHGTQKKISKIPKNPTPRKPTLNTKQGQLKTGQTSNMHAPPASLSKNGQAVTDSNKMKSESQVPLPAFQLSAGKVKPNTGTGSGKLFKSITSKKSEKCPDTHHSATAMQTTVDKREKYCSSTRDQLTAFYPQWQNKDALCWMDVILCLLVHCKQVNKLQHGGQDSDPSILFILLKAYDQALSLLNKRSISSCTSSLRDVDISMTMSDNSKTKSRINSASSLLSEEKLETRCLEEDENHLVTNSVKNEEEVKTGAGLQLLKSDFLKLMTSHSDSEYSKAFDLLGDVREKIWNLLHPRLRCKKGKNDSPVFAIPLLTNNSKDLEQLLSIKYSFHFICTKCGFQDVLPYHKVLPTFPNTVKNFSMNDPKFLRPCFQCLANGQTMTMVFERLPPVLMLHFQEGLYSNKFSDYDFYHQNQLYQVTGVIQYRNDPDHFIAWIRNPKVELWMECNDLKSPVCQFDQSSPGFPASQVHIMMWEAVGPEDCSDVQNSTKMTCNKDSFGNSHIEVSMETSVSSESDLMSFITGKGDTMNSVNSNCSSDTVSRPSCLGSLPSQKSINLTHIGDCHSPTVVSEINATSVINQVMSSKHTGKVGNILSDQMWNRGNNEKPGEVKRFQLGKLSTSGLPGGKKSYNGASNFNKSQVSTHADKILNKTKDNVAFLRNMRNPRTSQVSSDSTGHPNAANLKCLQGQGSLSFLTRILGNSKTKTTIPPVVKGKVFEGYKSKTFDATFFTSKNRTKNTSAEVDLESLTSRPNSPALSCHSDSFVIQKRKSELLSENNKLPALKRRRSQDANFTLACPPVRTKSLDTAMSLTGEQQLSDKTSDMNGSIVETTAIGSQCSSNSELLTLAVRNDNTFQESDILQNLYSALNIEMPANTDGSKSPVKAVGSAPIDVENIPDISDLDNFINSSCDSSMEDNLDDFLSEL